MRYFGFLLFCSALIICAFLNRETRLSNKVLNNYYKVELKSTEGYINYLKSERKRSLKNDLIDELLAIHDEIGSATPYGKGPRVKMESLLDSLQIDYSSLQSNCSLYKELLTDLYFNKSNKDTTLRLVVDEYVDIKNDSVLLGLKLFSDLTSSKNIEFYEKDKRIDKRRLMYYPYGLENLRAKKNHPGGSHQMYFGTE